MIMPMTDTQTLPNQLDSIKPSSYFALHNATMAVGGRKVVCDNDPWKISAFISALMEFLLSVLLLLGAAIAFITSQLVKFFGLEPPCTYIGCTHSVCTSATGSQKDSSHFDQQKDCPSWAYSKLQNEESSCVDDSDGCKSISREDSMSRDYLGTSSNLDVCSYRHQDTSERCDRCDANSLCLHNQLKSVIQKALVEGRDKDYVPLPISECSSNSDADDSQCEISSTSSHPCKDHIFQEEYLQRKALIRGDSSIHSYEAVFGDSEDESCHLLVEGMVEETLVAPLLGAMQAETASNLFLRSDEVQDAHQRALQMRDTVMEDRLAHLRDEEPIHIGFEAFDTNTDNLQGFANIGPSNSEEGVASQIGDEGNFKTAENTLFAVRDLLDIPFLENKQVADADEGSLFETENESMVLEGLGEVVEKQQFGCGLKEQALCKDFNQVLSNVQPQDAKGGNEVLGAAGLQETYEGNQSDESKCILLNDSIHKAEGQHDGEIKSKTTLEVVIQEAMDQYLTSFKCSLTENKVDAFVHSSDEKDNQKGNVGGAEECSENASGKDCLEEENLECLHTHKGDQIFLRTGVECGVHEQKICEQMVLEGHLVKVEHDGSFHESEVETGVQQVGTLLGQGEGMTFLRPISKHGEREDRAALDEDQKEGLDALKEALRAERTVLYALEAELESERNAAAIATSEAMAMISRLQEEKSAMQMEVGQLQRMSEEKADYDEQALTLLKEILFKREKEKHALEKEVELYRERFLMEKMDMAKRREGKDSSRQPLESALLLQGIDEDKEFLSQEGNLQDLKAPPPSEELYRSGNTPRARWNIGFAEQFHSTPENIMKLGTGLEKDRGDPRTDGFNERHDFLQEPRGARRALFSSHHEETQFILERLWVLEEELQELRGEDKCGSPKHNSTSHEKIRHWDKDGTGISSPVHDVFEDHSASTCLGLDFQRSDAFNAKETLEDFNHSPKRVSGDYMVTARKKGMTPVISNVRLWNERQYDAEIIAYQDRCLVNDNTQCIVQASGGLMKSEAVEELAMRVEVLEADRELLREILESFRHRDAELNLLKEIAQHLRQLRMVGFRRALTFGLSSPTFGKDDYASVLKKRRYYNGPGQSQMLLVQQKSI